jgi:hypothetical protein
MTALKPSLPESGSLPSAFYWALDKEVFAECRARQSPALDNTHGKTRDGNGDPIPDSPRGIPPLGDEDEEETSPAGI